MGNDMQTLGGMISFTDSSEEIINIVKENLDSTNYYGPDGPYRVGDISGASSWSEAFAGMQQVLHPLENGLNAILGEDDRYYDPQPFLTAADAFITPGSWMVYRNGGTLEGYLHVLFKPASGPLEHHYLCSVEDIPGCFDSSLEGARKFAYSLLIEQGFSSAFAPTGTLPAWTEHKEFDKRFNARRKAPLNATPLSMPSRRS